MRQSSGAVAISFDNGLKKAAGSDLYRMPVLGGRQAQT
jgi:hypothetical protein